jgi:hypothetical protein
LGQYDDMPFSHEDYRRFTDNKMASATKREVKKAYFPTALFTWDKEFVIREMSGQGTAIDLFTVKHFRAKFPDQARSLN